MTGPLFVAPRIVFPPRGNEVGITEIQIGLPFVEPLLGCCFIGGDRLDPPIWVVDDELILGSEFAFPGRGLFGLQWNGDDDGLA